MLDKIYIEGALTVHVYYMTHETGQKTRVPRMSLSKPAGQTFLFRVILVRDILSSVDGSRGTHEMFHARHFSQNLP